MEENEIIENEEINESIELTPEEREEQEREKLINDLTTEMLECESRLSSSASDIGDWKVIKCYEASLQSLPLPYDIDDLMEKRQEMRNRINEIQEQLKELENN